jgi:hypothetical protein
MPDNNAATHGNTCRMPENYDLSDDERTEVVQSAALSTLREIEAERRGTHGGYGGAVGGALEPASLVRFAFASAAIAAPTAHFGSCWCGADLQFEGHQDGTLHVCCIGPVRHCFTP